jgi:hypothetical protein
MRQLDELHLAYPFAGSRLLRDLLRLRNVRVGRKHVATLMRRMGIAALSFGRGDFQSAFLVPSGVEVTDGDSSAPVCDLELWDALELPGVVGYQGDSPTQGMSPD